MFNHRRDDSIDDPCKDSYHEDEGEDDGDDPHMHMELILYKMYNRVEEISQDPCDEERYQYRFQVIREIEDGENN